MELRSVHRRPNQRGKSMLTNAIIGEERSIVSPVAGTTRDALDTQVSYRDHVITLVDTAGIRRPGQVQRGIEKYSVLRAVNAVHRSDITLLITDATELATAQDAHIAGLAWDTNRGLIVVVNKWDLVNRNRFRMERSLHRVQERLHFMRYVPVCFTSALTRRRHRGAAGHCPVSLAGAPEAGAVPGFAIPACGCGFDPHSTLAAGQHPQPAAHSPGEAGWGQPTNLRVLGK